MCSTLKLDAKGELSIFKQEEEGDRPDSSKSIFAGERWVSFSSPLSDDFFAPLDRAATRSELISAALRLSDAYAIIYKHPTLPVVLATRDVLGRCSFVWSAEIGRLARFALFVPDGESGWHDFLAGRLAVFDLDHGTNELYAREEPLEEDEWVTQIRPESVHLGCANADLLEVSDNLAWPESSAGPPPNDDQLRPYVSQLWELLCDSTRRQLLINSPSATRISVAFSGGVDSLLTAHAVAEMSPDLEIELINVAFGQDRLKCAEAPDRKRGIDGFRHLRDRFPNRQIRLVEVNVTPDELTQHRPKIASALRPADSIMDDSLGCVVFFVALNASSSSRLLFLGSGADELFGGYARHRQRWQSDGWPALVCELRMELARIGDRNFGRDCRIIAAASDTRVLPAMPLLDDELVRWAVRCPIDAKLHPAAGRGDGEKRLLRAALRTHGAGPLAAHPKQAMQFGSRVVHLNNGGLRESDDAALTGKQM